MFPFFSVPQELKVRLETPTSQNSGQDSGDRQVSWQRQLELDTLFIHDRYSSQGFQLSYLGNDSSASHAFLRKSLHVWGLKRKRPWKEADWCFLLFQLGFDWTVALDSKASLALGCSGSRENGCEPFFRPKLSTVQGLRGRSSLEKLGAELSDTHRIENCVEKTSVAMAVVCD